MMGLHCGSEMWGYQCALMRKICKEEGDAGVRKGDEVRRDGGRRE